MSGGLADKVITGLTPISSWNWGLLSLGIISCALLLFYSSIEKTKMTTGEIAVIATLAALAAIARVPFAAFPSVQPTTFIITVAGFVFGPRSGFLVGSLAALVSNFFLGQGPWTPWQMMAWGLLGVTAGWLGHILPRTGRVGLAIFGLVWGYLFGWIVDLSYWLTFVFPLTVKSLLATMVSSLWFDTMHAVANVTLLVLLGPSMINLLREFRQKLVVHTITVTEENMEEEMPCLDTQRRESVAEESRH